MSDVIQHVPVTLELPKPVYDRVNEAAAREQRSMDDMLKLLLNEGLDAHATSRQLWERVSAAYRNRLAHAGTAKQSAEEILEGLQNIREQVASELYP